MRAPATSRTILWLLAVVQAFIGVWAVAAPRSFFDTFPGLGHTWTARLPPYNEHLVRDVGALSLSLTALTVAAALTLERRMVVVTALAWLLYSVPHLAFHIAHLQGFGLADRVGQLVSLSLGVVLPMALLALARGGRRRALPGLS